MKNQYKNYLFFFILFLTFYSNAMKVNAQTEEQKLEQRMLELLKKEDKSFKNKQMKFVHFHYVEYRGFDFKSDLASSSLIRKLNPTYYYNVHKGESFIRTESFLFTDEFKIVAFGDARRISIIIDNNPPFLIVNEVDFIRSFPECKIYHLMGLTKGNYFVAFCKEGMKYFKSEKEGYIEILLEEYIENL